MNKEFETIMQEGKCMTQTVDTTKEFELKMQQNKCLTQTVDTTKEFELKIHQALQPGRSSRKRLREELETLAIMNPSNLSSFKRSLTGELHELSCLVWG